MSRLPAPINPIRLGRTSNKPPVGEQVVSVSSSVVIERLATLSSAAQTLNDLSDQLTQEVLTIEEALNKLNLGLHASVNAFDLEESDDRMYSHWLRLAYAKGSGKWGFMVEELTESIHAPERDTYASWPFKEAPRDFRLKVVDKIPALLDALVKQSSEFASEITKKVKFAQELAVAITLNSPLGSKK